MNASFADIHAAADFIGPGAVEVPLYQTEIFDICRRSSPFGQRIKQVPATGHPSRFFEETALPNPGTAGFVNPRSIVAPVVSPTRVERSVPLKAIVSQINYNLFDVELGNQQQQFAYLQAKDLVDTVSGVMRHARRRAVERQRHQPQFADNHAVHGRHSADRRRRPDHDHRHLGLHRRRHQVRGCANGGEQRLPRASHGHLCQPGAARSDRSRDEDRVQRGAQLDQITGGFRVKMLSTQAGDLPLIPDWSLSYTGTPGSGSRSVARVHRDRGPDRVSLAR